MTVTAQDQVFRDTLAGIAMAVMIESPAISTSPEQQNALAELAGTRLIDANQNLIITRSGIGAAQEAIEDAKVEARSERTAMELAFNEIVSIDHYERATRLEEVETQVEMLYALTVRSSNLSLMNFLR